MNFDRLRFVAERAELGEAREALFAVTIPSARARSASSARARPRVVTEFNYRLSGRDGAHLRRRRDRRGRRPPSYRDGCASGYETLDLSDNEMAKLHVRHMVGGRPPRVRNERFTASSSRSGPAR